MTRRKRTSVILEEPSVGDYMVESDDGEAKCFNGEYACEKAYDYAHSLKSATVHRYVGWEHMATIGMKTHKRG